MRKLKQAAQREKARRALKEKKALAEAGQVSAPPAKPGTAGGRNGHAPPVQETSAAGSRSQKATLH